MGGGRQNKLNPRQENVLFKNRKSDTQNKFLTWSRPPSILLDGEQETIKEFAAKQHQPHRTLHCNHTILVTSTQHHIGWGARDNKKSLLRSSINPTGLYIPSIAFWSPPPSIQLDGEPETIKEFAAKQQQPHSTLHSTCSILVTSPQHCIGLGAGDNKISLLRSSINPTGLYIPSLVFWSPPPSIVLDGEPETIK